MAPHPGSPVVGQGLRAYANGQGLRHFGHEVLYCTRTEDLPVELEQARKKKTRQAGKTAALAKLGGPLGSAGNPYSFTEAAELQAIVQTLAPEVILLEAPEDARRLPEGDFTVVLDLYAPRILEAQYQEGTEERDAVRLFDAIQRADHFLFSNERQKHFFLPLLALAGVDCTRVEGDVVRISCPPKSPKRGAPSGLNFVAGGVFWPWADLSDGLRDLLFVLDELDEGSVRLFGGKYGIRSETTRYLDPRNKLPNSKRLSFSGIVPIDSLWSAYTEASVAFDLMAPNTERSLNLSFRQIDYLRCGLPLITSPGQVIASDLEEYGAGWCVKHGDTEGLRSLVARLASDPKILVEASKNAQKLAREKYGWTKTVAPLHTFIASGQPISHSETFLSRITREQADLWEDREANKQLRAQVSRYRSDLDKKTAELVARNRSAEAELADWEQERRTIRDEAAEAIEFARQQKLAALVERDQLKSEADTLSAQVSLLRADVRKKTQALLKAQHDRESLQEEDAQRAQSTWAQAEREIKKATRERDLAAEKCVVVEARLDDMKRELEVAQTGILKAQSEREQGRQDEERRIQQIWTQANSEVLKAQSETSDTEDKLVRAKVRISELEADVRRKTDDLMNYEVDRERLQQESDQHLQEVWRSANAKTVAAQEESQDLRNELAVRRARIEELEGELKSKERAIFQALEEREVLRQQSEQRIQELWNENKIRSQRQEQHFVEVLAEAEERAKQLLEASGSQATDHRANQTQALARAEGRIDELEFECNALRDDVAKKEAELMAAFAQRDAANEEKKALEAFLNTGASEEESKKPSAKSKVRSRFRSV